MASAAEADAVAAAAKAAAAEGLAQSARAAAMAAAAVTRVSAAGDGDQRLLGCVRNGGGTILLEDWQSGRGGAQHGRTRLHSRVSQQRSKVKGRGARGPLSAMIAQMPSVPCEVPGLGRDRGRD